MGLSDGSKRLSKMGYPFMCNLLGFEQQSPRNNFGETKKVRGQNGHLYLILNITFQHKVAMQFY